MCNYYYTCTLFFPTKFSVEQRSSLKNFNLLPTLYMARIVAR